MAFNQRENLKQAIRNHKARIAEIEAILHRPVPIRQPGRGLRPSAADRRNLAIEREHLLQVVDDLARLLDPPPRMCTAIPRPSVAAAEPAQREPTESTEGQRVAFGGRNPLEGTAQLRLRRLPKYRSKVKLAIRRILLDGPEPERLSVVEICRLMDDHAVDLPAKWKQENLEAFEDAYGDQTLRQHIHRLVDKVKADLKRNGLF